jgi:AbrB family looped-hinge helix DNA binding protein
MVPMHGFDKKVCYGTTTVGEKGQVVIPMEARKAMKIPKGEKLLVFGMGKDILVLATLSNLKKMASHLEERLKGMQAVIKKSS